jgi:hypothetical protein
MMHKPGRRRAIRDDLANSQIKVALSTATVPPARASNGIATSGRCDTSFDRRE